MPKQEKITEVAELKELISRASSLYFLDFTAVTANDFNLVRRRLRESGATVRVAKNRLALRAMAECGVAEGVAEFLRGPTSLVIGAEDPIAPARALRDLAKRLESLKIKGVYLDRTAHPAGQFQFLAALPTKSELRAQVVGVLSGPISGLVWTLEGLLSELVYVAEEIAKRPQPPSPAPDDKARCAETAEGS